MRWDDIGRIFVNGDEFYMSTAGNANSGYVEIPLRTGWSTVMIKCANYTGAWSFQIAIENAREDLILSSRKK